MPTRVRSLPCEGQPHQVEREGSPRPRTADRDPLKPESLRTHAGDRFPRRLGGGLGGGGGVGIEWRVPRVRVAGRFRWVRLH